MTPPLLFRTVLAAFLNAVVLSGELQFQYSHFCVGLVINYVQILKKFLFQMNFYGNL